jgi:hypothetical protein
MANKEPYQKKDKPASKTTIAIFGATIVNRVNSFAIGKLCSDW